MQSTNFRAYPTRAQRRGGDGIDYVRCRVCGDHRSVISCRHLSKHGIDRQAYMQEYRLSRPSSAPNPSGSITVPEVTTLRLMGRSGLPRSRLSTSGTDMCTLASCKSTIPNSISRVFGFLVTGMQLCVNRGSRQRICGYGRIGMTNELLARYSACVERAYLCTRLTF